VDARNVQRRRSGCERGPEPRGSGQEVVATLVGSIGLLAAVPITTALAALLALSVEPNQIADADGHTH
jgi:hypothetical protein